MATIPALPRRLHGPSIWALYLLGLCPAAWYFYLGATGGLGFNPVKTFEHLLGIWALREEAASEIAQLLATERPVDEEIGRAHVRTPVTNAHIVCRLMLATKKTIT